MADVQIAVIDQQNTQIALAAPSETEVTVAVPGVQGPVGEGVPSGGTANQVLFKQSGTDYDTAWSEITSEMIGDLEIVNADVATNAAIAGSKISPDFGAQNITTTGTSTAANFIPTSSSVPTNGVYLPSTNTVALSTNGTGRLFVDAAGRVGINTSTPTNASTPISLRSGGSTPVHIYADSAYWGLFDNGGTAGGYAPGNGFAGHATNNYLNFFTAAQERLRITSAGLVGIGTSSPSESIHTTGKLRVADGGNYTVAAIQLGTSNANGISYPGTNILNFITNSTAALTIDASQRVGIGVTNPGSFDAEANQLVVGNGAGNKGITIYTGSGAGDYGSIFFADGTTGGAVKKGQIRYEQNNEVMSFWTNETERCRIDLSGRLLVGTSSAPSAGSWAQYARLVINGNTIDPTGAGILNLAVGTPATSIASGNSIGVIPFSDNGGNEFGLIGCFADATAGSGDYPGRLVFSTTADGASSPTERMRIESGGNIRVAASTYIYREGANGAGIGFGGGGVLPVNSAGAASDNTVPMGAASYRWSVIYAGTGTINTSDLNLKQDIESITTAELAVAVSLKSLIKKFRFKDAVAAKGDDARIHVGVIAQEVEQAFVDAGLDPRRYALFCEDELEDGTKRLGIRYDELLAFVIAAF